MEASSSSFSFSKEFLVHLLNQWEKLCMHVHVGTFVTDHLYHVKQQPFCHAAAWAWTLCPVLMLAADEVAIITNRKPFTLTILCKFLMKKMQLPKIRNGVFVSCDNDCIHMYGKSVLSMSMTYQKSKEGRGYSLQWPIWGG